MKKKGVCQISVLMGRRRLSLRAPRHLRPVISI